MKDKMKLTIARIFNIDLIYSIGEACILIGIFILTMLALDATFTIGFCVALIVIGVLTYIIGIVCELYGKKQYKEKPVVTDIEVFKYDGNIINLSEWYAPDWVKDAYKQGIIFYDSLQDMFIEMSEGIYHVNVGDYIVRGANGEIYPCKPDRLTKLFK